jgi:hypothetical protein
MAARLWADEDVARLRAMLASGPCSLLADPFRSTALLAEALAAPLPVKHRSSLKRRRAGEAASNATPASTGAPLGPAADEVPPQTPRASGGADTPAPPASGAVAEATPSPEPQALDDETLGALRALRRTLGDEGLPDEVRASRAAKGLETLLALVEPAGVRAAYAALETSDLSDGAVQCASVAAARPHVSSRAAGAFVGHMLLPRVARLEQAASRTLFSALLALMEHHARALVDALVVPAMWCGGGALSGGQAEVLARLVREAPEAQVGRALEAFLAGEGGQPTSWTEAQVGLVQAMLARKPPLEGGAIGELLVQADANVDALRKSLKFSNVLSTLVRSYGPLLRPHLDAVRRVAERLETFMKRSILAAVAKLEAA